MHLDCEVESLLLHAPQEPERTPGLEKLLGNAGEAGKGEKAVQIGGTLD